MTTGMLLSACSLAASSEEDSRDSGREYGRTLRDTIGARTTEAELESLCGKGLVDGKLVDPKGGRPGDETDLEADAFIEGCMDVVAGK